MNQAAKDLQEGNFVAFEEFTSYDDSDYDSSDYDDPEPPHPIDTSDKDGKPIQPVPEPVRPSPQSDKNHDVKPKDSFLIKNPK